MKLNIFTILSGLLFIWTQVAIFALLIHCNGGNICVYGDIVVFDIYVTFAFLIVTFIASILVKKFLGKGKKSNLANLLLGTVVCLLAMVLINQILWLPFTLKSMTNSLSKTYTNSSYGIVSVQYPSDLFVKEEKPYNTFRVAFTKNHGKWDSKECVLSVGPQGDASPMFHPVSVNINGDIWARSVNFNPRFFLPIDSVSGVFWQKSYKGNIIEVMGHPDKYIMCEKILSTLKLQ